MEYLDIGNVNTRLCSAVKCFKIKGDHGISENAEDYWLNCEILDVDVRMSKDSPEGQKLTDMINQSKPLVSIQRFIDQSVLKRVSASTVYAKIQQVKRDAFESGRRSMQREIQEVLGI